MRTSRTRAVSMGQTGRAGQEGPKPNVVFSRCEVSEQKLRQPSEKLGSWPPSELSESWKLKGFKVDHGRSSVKINQDITLSPQLLKRMRKIQGQRMIVHLHACPQVCMHVHTDKQEVERCTQTVGKTDTKDTERGRDRDRGGAEPSSSVYSICCFSTLCDQMWTKCPVVASIVHIEIKTSMFRKLLWPWESCFL